MQSERKTEILVGLFLFVGLLMLGGIILQFGGLREWFTDTYSLRVAFPNAAGIREGSPVYLGGSKVGKVARHPQLNDSFNGILVDLKIRDDVDIPADSIFAIGSAGLMGDALVEIRPGSGETAAFLPHDHAEVIEGAKSGGLADLQSTAEQVGRKVDVVLDDLKIALKDVREAVAKINREALAEDTVKDFKQGMHHLNQTLTRVDEKVLGEENTDEVKAAIADLRAAAASFKTTAQNAEAGSAKLGPLIDRLDPAVARADRVMATAEDALKAVKTAADSFALTARQIQSGKGLLGALVHDAELKTDLKDLIANMKRNGVLFYRDSATRERERAEEKASPKPAPRLPFLGR